MEHPNKNQTSANGGIDRYPPVIPGIHQEELEWYIHLPQYSPDLRLLAVAAPARPLLIYTAKTRQLLWKLPNHDGDIDFDWSPDSKYIAIADDAGVYVLDAQSGVRQYAYSGLNSRVRSPEWSPDGKYLLAIGFLKGQKETTAVLHVWDAASQKVLCKICDGPASEAHWAPDGRRVAFNGPAVEVWDVFDNKRIVQITIPKRGWPPFSWSPNGNSIVIADLGTGEATIYDARNGKADSRHKFSEDTTFLDWLTDGTIRAVSNKTEFWKPACDNHGNPKVTPVREPVIGDEGYIPKNIDECIRQLDLVLPKQTIKDMTAKQEDEMILYHHGLGTWMRNDWGLRGGSDLSRYLYEMRVKNPDDMSYLILSAYWCHLHGKPFEIELTKDAAGPLNGQANHHPGQPGGPTHDR